MNGDAANVGQVVVGSNGGLATIYADGTIDFDANNEFDHLMNGDTAQTSFTYAIEGGDTATVTVNVEGEDNGNNGPQPVINLALMLNSAITVFEQAQTTTFGLPPYQDWNADGVANQVMDMAYLMLEDFMTDAFDVAANAGYQLNVALITFDDAGLGEGGEYLTVSDAASFGTLLDQKVAQDDSGDYGAGFDNANSWFTDVAGTDDTNAVFFLANGFSSDPFADEQLALFNDHGAIIDSYLPDAVFAGSAYETMNGIDKDGVTDAIYIDDPVLADTFGVTAGQDALSLDHLIA